MSPHVARPLLHTVHVLTFAALLATGLLLFVPALRETLTGGYSLWISAIHRWGGIAYVLLPAIVVLRGGVRATLVGDRPATIRGRWQGVHVAITAAMTLLFTVTGFVLWARRSVPDGLLDASQALHDWLTWAALILLAAHFLELGAAALRERLSSYPSGA